MLPLDQDRSPFLPTYRHPSYGVPRQPWERSSPDFRRRRPPYRDIPQIQVELESIYWPFGRPGAGAPCSDSIRRRKNDLPYLPEPYSYVNMEPPWGKSGPGSKNWKTPRQVGMNFLHSLGWTGEKAFRRLEDQIDHHPTEQLMIQGKGRRDFKTPEEEFTGGVELVPLLARRRSFKKTHPLPSTDVTKKTDEMPPPWLEPPQEYLRDLNSQVSHKQRQIQVEKEEDKKDCRRHFETLGGFWGRPGHGAPRQVKVKENINHLLYQQPVI